MFHKKKIILPLSWITLIYLSIPFIRRVSESLLRSNYFLVFISVFVLIIFLLILIKALKDKLSFLLLFIAIIVGCLYTLNLTAYEELFHYFEYGLLSVLILHSYKNNTKEIHKICITIFLVLFLGYLDEVIQYFIPERFFDWNDVLLNFVSGVIGVMIYYSSIANIKTSGTIS